MRIAFMQHSIEMRSWSNKDEMMRFLTGCEAETLLLGENREQEVEFYTILIYLNHSSSYRLGVGICSQGHGLIPHILPQPENSILFLGFNNNVVGVHIPKGDIILELNFDSLFYSFLPLYMQKMLIIQHEIGVVALTQNNKILWQFSKDIITNTAVEDDQLYLEFMDSSPVRLRLSDGVVISSEVRQS